MRAKLYTWILGGTYLVCAVLFFVIISGFQSVFSELAIPIPHFTKVVLAISPVGWLLLTVAVGTGAVFADLRFRSRFLGFVFVMVLALMGCCITVGVLLPMLATCQMAGNAPPNNGAAANSHRPISFDRAMKFGHHHCSQAQSPVAVPELWR